MSFPSLDFVIYLITTRELGNRSKTFMVKNRPLWFKDFHVALLKYVFDSETLRTQWDREDNIYEKCRAGQNYELLDNCFFMSTFNYLFISLFYLLCINLRLKVNYILESFLPLVNMKRKYHLKGEYGDVKLYRTHIPQTLSCPRKSSPETGCKLWIGF